MKTRQFIVVGAWLLTMAGAYWAGRGSVDRAEPADSNSESPGVVGRASPMEEADRETAIAGEDHSETGAGEEPAPVDVVTIDEAGRVSQTRHDPRSTTDGYAAAQAGVAEALARLDEFGEDDEGARAAFLSGIFRYVAETFDTATAVELAQALTEPDRSTGLLALGSVWTGRTLDPTLTMVAKNGVVGAIGGFLAESGDETQAREWLEAFPGHPYQPFMRATLADRLVREGMDAEAVLQLGDSLEGWEREAFLGRFGALWHKQDPAAAWEWASGLEGSLDRWDELAAWMLSDMASKDPEAAMGALGDVRDPGARQRAIEAIGKSIAMGGTERAVEWADALSDPVEQEIAHSAIYEATPRGIGVVLRMDDGTVAVGGLLPEGAAARSGGMLEGDRIVQVDPGDGRFRNAIGIPMEDVANLIRGEAGAPLRLRILRGEGGATENIEVFLNREQVIIPERGEPSLTGQ